MYNGWSNYETWLTALWVSDDLHEYSINTLGGELDAEQTRNFVEEILSIPSQCVASAFASDLVNAALDKVNWQELADATKGE
jgi:hypothetical protein